jgi:hypothetical protein
MSAGNIFWLLILVAVVFCYSFFILRGRAYGYQALARRVSQLLNQGVNNVWLMYGDKGVGYDINLAHTSVWTLLNTGFLAYRVGQQLIVEFPWWNNMRPLLTIPIAQISPNPVTIVYARRTYSAVRIGHQSYVILSLNTQDVGTIKQLLKMQNHEDSEVLLAGFTNALAAPQPVSTNTATDTLSPIPEAKLSIWKVIRGVFLYVLLPCLLLTAALILWAVLTKQPAFR